MAAGFHTTGMCGFRFPLESVNIFEGCIYNVVIISGMERYSVHRLYGDQEKLLSEFVAHELLPRHDYKYMTSTTEEVLSNSSDIIAYKNLLIRLRRGKRGLEWRGAFKGVDYPYKLSDFSFFKMITETKLEFWLAFLDARYLWSVLDTYADYGDSTERLAALAVSNYMYAERFFQTQRCLFDFIPKIESEKITEHQLDYWGGMKTNQLADDDALDVFLTRNIEVLNISKVIKRIFIELIKRSSVELQSGLGVNLNNSKVFTGIFEQYSKKYFD